MSALKPLLKSGVICLLVSLAILCGGVRASATGGKVDYAFNPATGGVTGSVFAMAVQDDGRVIIGGAFGNVNGVARSNIARLNADGSPDTSFNSEIGANNTVNALALQADGKIVIVGDFNGVGGTSRSHVARLNADGSLDTSFVCDVIDNFSSTFVSAVAVQSNGKVVIGGFFGDIGGVQRDSLARLNADGSLDTSFNTSVGQGRDVFTIVVQPDDALLIGGLFDEVNGVARGSIARLNADGSLDTSFDPGTGVGGEGFEVHAVALQPDGKIVIGGLFTTVNNVPRKNIARLTVSGAPDASFDPGTGANNIVYAVAVQENGSILIGGEFTFVNDFSRHRIARLTGAGALDNSFSTIADANNTVYAIAVQSDQRSIIGGSFTSMNGFPHVSVARLNTNGTLDNAFVADLASSGTVYAVALQPDGKLIVGGSLTTINGTFRGWLGRLNADGTLDAAFNPLLDNAVRAVAFQPDGKIVIGGDFTTINGISRKRIARLNPNGSLDTSFNPGMGAVNTVRAVVIQPDGRIVIGGSFTNYNGVLKNRIARLNPDGSLEDSMLGVNSTVTAVVLQPDGKLILGGAFSTFRPRLIRLNAADGSLDNSFNTTGAYLVGGQVNAVALQPDGRIIVGGLFYGVGTSPFTVRHHLARFNADGSLDASFDPGPGVDGPVNTILVQPDGKIVVGGLFTTVNGSTRNGVARLNADGSPDASFTTVVGVNGPVMAMALQPDGKLVVGGHFNNVDNSTHYGLARLFGHTTVVSDFDGDGRTDISVWQSDSGKWHIVNSTDNSERLQFWGESSLGDIAVPGDYDGDRKTDVAIYRPSEGNWYILRSSDGAGTVQGWGQAGDVPVAADYDGDGLTDVAVFRPSEGNWYVRQSGGGSLVQGWGDPTDKLVPGDYDGDGRADVAVFRPADGNWYIRKSTGGLKQQQWGLSEDRPVAGDYDGDGTTDIAVFRPSEGNWYIIRSGGGGVIRNWGDASDRPVPGDYDGDGRTDIAVWRPSQGTWYFIQSGDGSGAQRYLGLSTDTPIPAAYLPQ